MNKSLFIKCLFFITVWIVLVALTGCDSDNTFVIKEINLEMVKCPAGSFMMGSPDNELGRNADEKLHLVTITKPFYIGKFEVTQSQYVALMEKNPSKIVGANNPVESVTYYDAKAFCDKINLKYLNQLPQGYKFDLPTEAQWEYACRAGTTTALNNGKEIKSIWGDGTNIDEIAWNNHISRYATQDVGQKKPNAWGIYDMHGNVWEWCRDWYGEYTEKEVTDPLGPISGPGRVCRGGSCNNNSLGSRSAIRGCIDSSRDKGDEDTGFRVALVPVE